MKKAFALLVNDLHINKDNISEFVVNFEEVCSVCEDRNIDKILIGGDLFTTRSSQALASMLTVYNCLQNAGRDKGLEIHIVNGNHDKPDLSSVNGWCNLFAHLPKVHVYDTGVTFQMSSQEMLMMLPYFPEDDKMQDVVRQCLEETSTPEHTTLYLHSGIHGALGDFDVPHELPTELLTPFKQVLVAHYHNRTTIKNTNIHYIGSSRAHNFGEDEEKGYTIIYTDGSTEFIKNEVNVRYVTEELAIGDLKDWKNRYDARYKVRLKIRCTAAEADIVDREELISRGAHKIEFVTERLKAVEQPINIEESFDTNDLQQEYSKFCKDKKISSKLGIEYLNKIS